MFVSDIGALSSASDKKLDARDEWERAPTESPGHPVDLVEEPTS